MTPKFDFTNAVSDEREAKDGWCKGGYTCVCTRCQKSYFGDKRSWSCADCAYEGSNDPTDYQAVVCECCLGSGIEFVLGGHGDVMEIPCSLCSMSELTRAILSERQRCAAIVDEIAVEFERQAGEAADGMVHDSLLMASDALELAASSIRECNTGTV